MTPGLNPQLVRDWASIRSELRRAVPDSTFEIWLEPLTARALVGDTLVVGAPDEIRSWISDRFARVLQTCAAAVLGPQTFVDVVAPDAPLEVAAPQTRARASASAATPDAPQTTEAEFHPKLTFDQFVIGDGNRFAHAAALAVAELPAQTYNPLFLYGPPGLGKTHLLHAIGNYIREHGGGLRVRSTTAERFTNEFVAALQAHDVEDFKARFRDTDVLLIDDVQFLQRKAKTEEEFFHTFNTLYETGSQLVLTCDRLPADMAALEARLLERFQAGLVAQISPPDLATRLAILRKRVQHDGIELADDGALHAIAHAITTNPRALEGALIRVVAYHSLTRRPIDVELANEVLAGLYPNARPQRAPLTIERVQELTCEAFSLSREELLSSGRSGRVSWPRQVAMYLARQHTGETLPAIGRQFGGRNHTTVMYACRRAGERLAADPEAKAVVSALERRLVDGA
jgi:chromosomal replication initiator protein